MTTRMSYHYDPDAPEVGLGDPRYWLVCEHPERPTGPAATPAPGLHAPRFLCPGCVIWAEAALARGDHPNIGAYLDEIGDVEQATGRRAIPSRPEPT